MSSWSLSSLEDQEYGFFFCFKRKFKILIMFFFTPQLLLEPPHLPNYQLYPLSFNTLHKNPKMKIRTSKRSIKQKCPNKIKMKQKVNTHTYMHACTHTHVHTEFILCWPTTPVHGTCPKVWLRSSVTLPYRTLIFFWPMGINCKWLLS